MKKAIILLLYFCIFSSFYTQNLFSQSGWFSQNINPPNTYLTKSFFIDINTGFACGSNGVILKTINGGTNWSVYNTGSSYTFYSIYFVNPQSGWAVGEYNLVYKTTNSGVNWVSINTGITGHWFSTYFINENIGWIVGSYIGSYPSKILITTNGGANWTIQDTSTASYLNKICFTDNNTGWVIGSGSIILKTTNQGANWFSIPSIISSNLKSLSFINNNIGWILGNSVIKTTNGGLNWVVQNVSGNSIYFEDSNTGIVVGDYGAISRTTNGGSNWIQIISNNLNNLYSVELFGTGEGYTIGGDSYNNSEFAILKTSNFGDNWIVQWERPQKDFYGITAANGQIAWVMGGDDAYLKKTTDGGNSWFIQNSAASVRLITGLAINENLCWVLGYGGVMTKTTNGGTNWMLNYTGGGSSDLKFIDINTGWSVGGSAILRTTNAGNNWIEDFGHMTYCNSVYFINSQTGFVVGGDVEAYPPNTYYYFKRIDKSNDGGVNWITKLRTSVQGNGPFAFTSICFINDNTGFCVGAGNHYLITTNSGENWIEQNLGINCNFQMILFKNSNIGWIVGSGGNIIKTINGGSNWYSQNSGTTQDLNKICFVDLMTGWICGMGGTILHTTDGGGSLNPIGLITQNKYIPIHYSLSQNYPNPFNPTTKINFELPKSSFTKLIIYDILGREAATLVNEELKPGSYEYEWNASGFASGVYFYKLMVEDPETSSGFTFSQTKRMVLIK